MYRLIPRVTLFTLVLILLTPSIIFAQWGIPDVDVPDIVDELPGIENLIAGIPGLGGGQYEPALTTSLADAVYEVPFLDNYDPEEFERLLPLPGWPDNGYREAPGRYEVDIESFCLHAGVYGPSEGQGYLYAPLRGPRASVISNILRNSAYFPDIPQTDLQILIWGILARTKISDMNSDLQYAASLLLTSDEINDLNGGALGLIPDDRWTEVFNSVNVSAPLQQVIETEGRLRSRLTSGGSSYSEIESIAVLSGIAPYEEGTRVVPGGRWSYHPDGYFIRYFAHSYSRTTVQLSIPCVFRIERDELDRITTVTDQYGNAIEVDYDDTIASLNFNDDSAAGYSIGTISLVPALESTVANTDWQPVHGWVLSGVPADARYSATESGHYSNVTARTEWAARHKSDVERLCALMPYFDARSSLADNAIQIGLLCVAVQESFGGTFEGIEPEQRFAVELLMEAWQHAISLAMLDFGDDEFIADAKDGKGGEDRGGEEGIDLSGGSATPAGNSQRLGQGGRETDPMSPDEMDLLRRAHEYGEGYEQGYKKGYNNAYPLGGDAVPDVDDENDVPVSPLSPSDAPDRSAGSDAHWQGYCDGYEIGWWQGYHDGYDDIYNVRFGG